MEKTYNIHLQNDIPKFGHGRKLVTVTKIGTKWVWVTKTHTNRKARIRKTLWIRLLGTHITLRGNHDESKDD